MSFLAPLFFAGLAALAIPVLIHLIQRERKNVVVFPSLMFVRRIPYSSIRRRRIHNWALLAMRLAALALIILAFARPFFRAETLSAAAGGARDVVVLLDRSYSMGHGDQWTRARSAASDVINGLSQGDRATLVLFANGAEIAVQKTDDRARLLSEINNTEVSAGGTRFGPALKLAGSLLADSTLPRREVVVISDFQRHGWTPGDGLRLPDGTTVIPVTVSAGDATNLSVTPVALQRETFSGQERVIITGGVINRSPRQVDIVDLTLEIDGRVVQTQRVSVAPHASASTTFAPLTVPPATARAVVRIPGDALAADNAFHFMLTPPRPIAITLVSGSRGARESLYLTRALSIGEAPRFQVSTAGTDGLSDEVLGKSRVIVLNDAAVSDTQAARLKRFVENGGGLFVVHGPQSSWPSDRVDILPVSPTGTVDRTRGAAGTLSGLEYGHSVFEPFRSPRSGNFSTARFYGYRSVTAAKDAQVLARFDDGTPALVERAQGRGRVLLWNTTLDLFWNDLALKPVFLPFTHQIIRHLASHRERAPWSTVGQVIDVADTASDVQAAAAENATRSLVLTPAGKRLEIEGDQTRVLELGEQGFYEIREARQGGQTVVTASNVELNESDRAAVDPQEIVAAVAGGGGAARGPSGEPLAVPDEAHERSQRIWWYLLFAGILLLTAESVFAHRLSRAV